MLDQLDMISGFVGDVIDQLGLALLQREGVRMTGYKQARYDLPDSLPGEWRVAAPEASLQP